MKLVKLDSVVIESIDQISAERIIENLLRQFCIDIFLQIDLFRYYPLRKAKTGILMGLFTASSNGFSDHQFCRRYFSDLSLKVGIDGSSLNASVIGCKYLLSVVTVEKHFRAIALMMIIIKNNQNIKNNIYLKLAK